MKKLLIFSVFSIFTLSSFGTKELKKEDTPIKMTTWYIYCNGVYSGSLTCDCNQGTAFLAAMAVCNK